MIAVIRCRTESLRNSTSGFFPITAAMLPFHTMRVAAPDTLCDAWAIVQATGIHSGEMVTLVLAPLFRRKLPVTPFRFLRVDPRARRSSKRMKGILAALNQENPHGQQEHDLPLA
ncbi:MAG TPA: hypothetical protein VIO59_00635 [Rhodanobacter sp.]